MLLPMAAIAVLMITGWQMIDDAEPEEAEVAGPSQPLADLGIENVALPVALRGHKKNRTQARHRIMDQLYDGSWRWTFPFSNHFRWFGSWLVGSVQTPAQKTQPPASQHKVRATNPH